MAHCSDVYRHICTNLDRRLNSPECRAIRKHLDACPDCRAYLQSVKKTIQLYRTLPVPPLSRADHTVLLRTIDRVWEEKVGKKRSITRRRTRTD